MLNKERFAPALRADNAPNNHKSFTPHNDKNNTGRELADKGAGQQSLNAPNPKTLTGLRDRAILALLLGCGLRRAELLRIKFEDLQQRVGR